MAFFSAIFVIFKLSNDANIQLFFLIREIFYDFFIEKLKMLILFHVLYKFPTFATSNLKTITI